MSDSEDNLRESHSEGEEDVPVLYEKKVNKKDHFEEGSDDDSELDSDEGLEKETHRSSSNEDLGKEDGASELHKKNSNTKGNFSSNQDETAPLLKTKEDKLERLKKVKATKKTKHKTGVIYLSKIPPYMKPAKLRQVLSRFGEVDRLFLKREGEQAYKIRIKSGGNKKTIYTEGWVEFIRKKDAKLCAATLNGNILGGRKGSFYHDDIINMKYLPGFKWADLTAQIARENDVRQAKLQLEISQANKLNAEYIRNVEKSKMLGKIRSKKRVQDDTTQDNEARTQFKQRKVTSNRATAAEDHKEHNSEKLDTVLHNLF